MGGGLKTPNISASISGGTGATVVGISPSSQTVLFDDLESTLLKWTQLLPTVSRINTRAYNGTASLHLAPVAGATCIAVRAFPTPASGKISLACFWACSDFSQTSAMYFSLASSVNTRIATIQYVPATHYWQVSDNTGFQTLLDSYHTQQYLPAPTIGSCWHMLNFVVDWDLNKYLSLTVDDMMLDISNYSCVYTTLNGPMGSTVTFGMTAQAGVTPDLYIDDIRVATE